MVMWKSTKHDKTVCDVFLSNVNCLDCSSQNLLFYDNIWKRYWFQFSASHLNKYVSWKKRAVYIFGSSKTEPINSGHLFCSFHLNSIRTNHCNWNEIKIVHYPPASGKKNYFNKTYLQYYLLTNHAQKSSFKKLWTYVLNTLFFLKIYF